MRVQLKREMNHDSGSDSGSGQEDMFAGHYQPMVPILGESYIPGNMSKCLLNNVIKRVLIS